MVKNLPANVEDARDTGSILGVGRSPGEGNGNPLQCPCLENPMDRGAWGGGGEATVHGVTKCGTQLSNSTRALHSTAVGNILSHILELFCRY